MFLILLPFLGSGLLTGTKIGGNLVITIAWCAGTATLSYVWLRRLYEREPKPR
jgi:ABC-2 type transport system permease protein